MDFDARIELLVNLAHNLAELLKDPTLGGKKEMTAEQRNLARESAYTNLLTTIDGLESAAYFQSAINDCFVISEEIKK